MLSPAAHGGCSSPRSLFSFPLAPRIPQASDDPALTTAPLSPGVL